MTPKEKANELVDKYSCIKDNYNDYEYDKKCALISVDEIINCDTFFKTLEDGKEFVKYWHEVQEEILKL